jgi:hypothetical protein
MEEENLITYLNLRLKEKANDTITYRKALTIYESLMETTSAVSNLYYIRSRTFRKLLPITNLILPYSYLEALINCF